MPKANTMRPGCWSCDRRERTDRIETDFIFFGHLRAMITTRRMWSTA